MKEEENSGTWHRIVLFPIVIYRKLISPMMKQRCIYYPTCSEYFELAVKKYGVARGSIKGIYRVLRCHPFAKGGYDPP